jgi:hypothetical protein
MYIPYAKVILPPGEPDFEIVERTTRRELLYLSRELPIVDQSGGQEVSTAQFFRANVHMN